MISHEKSTKSAIALTKTLATGQLLPRWGRLLEHNWWKPGMTCEIVTIERPTPRVVFAKIKKTNVASIINMSGFTNMQIHT